FLPAKIYYGQKTSQPTTRYFVDKFHMFLCTDPSFRSSVLTFAYLQGGGSEPHRICPSSESLPPAVSATLRVPVSLSSKSGFSLRKGQRTIPFHCGYSAGSDVSTSSADTSKSARRGISGST